MAKKYDYFNLLAQFGEVNRTFESYREAFMEYQKCDEPKTLYGVQVESCSISVIFSK